MTTDNRPHKRKVAVVTLTSTYLYVYPTRQKDATIQRDATSRAESELRGDIQEGMHRPNAKVEIEYQESAKPFPKYSTGGQIPMTTKEREAIG